jgi:hypothetical protein
MIMVEALAIRRQQKMLGCNQLHYIPLETIQQSLGLAI